MLVPWRGIAMHTQGAAVTSCASFGCMADWWVGYKAGFSLIKLADAFSVQIEFVIAKLEFG